MARVSFYSLAVLTLFTVAQATADDSKSNSDQNKHKGTIANLDSNKGSIEVHMKDHDGKQVDKTYQLSGDAKFLDSKGKSTKQDAFHQGDHVAFTEKDGKIDELRMARAHAKITGVDAKKGTVTVSMQDESGKNVEKTFQLTEDIEYVDSTGAVATVDVFQSGDQVLLVESEGHLKEMKKQASQKTTAKKESNPSGKTSSEK